MTLIEFKLDEGQGAVVAEHIESIEEMENGNCLVGLTSGSTMEIQASYEELCAMLTSNEKRERLN